MGWKSKLITPYVKYIAIGVSKMSRDAVKDQQSIFHDLIKKAKDTQFGKDHGFSSIKTHADYVKQVPIRDYEALRSYIDMIIKGQKDVLWPGMPKYFAKTSGTTSGVKYIPLTKDSIPNHMFTAQQAALNYIAANPKTNPFDGKLIFLGGSPELDQKGNIPTGRLSGIVNHEVPKWAQANKVPTYATNCIDDWETKLEKVVEETLPQDMRMISGIPPWVQMYYEKLLEVTGKSTVKEIFPNFNLFMYGGVNYEPYRATIEKLIGEKIPSVELFPASEGFFAFQDKSVDEGLLLNSNSGIFFEFIPLAQAFDDHLSRLTVDQVEVGVDYVLIINSNAGLWGYNIGDTVRFVSLNPYRIVVSGRVKHYISAFGEHVIGKEVENAMLEISQKHKASVVEFTVAPQVTPPDGSLPYHEWFVEFEKEPSNFEAFARDLDQSMTNQNIYYQDLIIGKILRPLVVSKLQRDSFRNYMKDQGKLGGQNKVPRLSNDRKMADHLQKDVISRN